MASSVPYRYRPDPEGNIAMNNAPTSRAFGRYVLCDEIASGGMATVHFGRLHGSVGFSRVVAIKRLHANYARDPRFVQMFLEEARLASCIKHPNVVSTLDVVADETEVFLVMEYVLGESLERLMPRECQGPIPVAVASSILCGVLEGLHAAHEAESEQGEPLEIVHRDVSPHNVLVGRDGVARVFDFGIAKSVESMDETREGVIKGKVTYMAPEQIRGAVDRRSDIYAAGVVLWELMTGQRRHAGERNDQLFLKLATQKVEAPVAASSLRSDVPAALDAVITKAMANDVDARYATAREMALALERAVPPAPNREVGEWLERVAKARIDQRARVARRVASGTESEGSVVAALPSGPGTHPGIGTGLNTTSVPVSPPTGSVNVQLPPRGRNYTMPAAFVAFAAVLLLVGLRTLPKRSAAEEPRAVPAAAAGRAVEAPPSGAPLATDLAHAPSAVVPAVAPEALDAAPTASRRDVAPGTKGPARHAAAPPGNKAQAAPVVAPVASASAAPKSAPQPAKPSCDVPFVIGADGIRQIKPECM